MRGIVNINGNYHQHKAISQRCNVPNTLYFLPFAYRITAVNGYTPSEILHTINQGLHTYQVEAFHSIIGETNAGNRRKHYTTNTFE